MNKIILLLVCFACIAAAIRVDKLHGAKKQFVDFVARYNKNYEPAEFAMRQKIFLRNLAFIEKFNSQNAFQVGINEFADMSEREFKARFVPIVLDHNADIARANISTVAPPAAVDWRNSSKSQVVGPVRTLGACAAPVLTSVVDSISSEYSVKFSEDFYSFDVSKIAQCDGQQCNGELEGGVWSYIEKYGLRWKYDPDCPTTPGVGMCISGHTCIAAGSESGLENAVATKGPIAVVIDASQLSFQLYTSGIYYEPKCSSSAVNHALLVVGYGSQNGQDYWIARNNWGADWGMNGDILLARNKNNNCGVATSACYATSVQNCVCAL